MNRIKIRNSWSICPMEKVHSSPKGARGYSRQSDKQAIDEAIEDYEIEQEELEELEELEDEFARELSD